MQNYVLCRKRIRKKEREREKDERESRRIVEERWERIHSLLMRLEQQKNSWVRESKTEKERVRIEGRESKTERDRERDIWEFRKITWLTVQWVTDNSSDGSESLGTHFLPPSLPSFCLLFLLILFSLSPSLPPLSLSLCHQQFSIPHWFTASLSRWKRREKWEKKEEEREKKKREYSSLHCNNSWRRTTTFVGLI